MIPAAPRVWPREQQAQARHHGPRGRGCTHHVRVMACLAEGLGIRGIARVFEVDLHTVLQWLVEAAEQLRVFSQHALHDVRVQQVQLDELFALLSAVKDGDVNAAEAIERLSRSPHWVWTAIDPETKLLLRVQVGARTLAMAKPCRIRSRSCWRPGVYRSC